MPPPRKFHEEVFRVVRRIPKGRVASYGLVARVAGHPRAARQVGMVMRLGRGLPWWRVVAQDGRIVIQNPEFRIEQALRLEAEGIRVVEGRVDYERHAWRPRVKAPPPPAPAPPPRGRRPPPSSSRRRR